MFSGTAALFWGSKVGGARRQWQAASLLSVAHALHMHPLLIMLVSLCVCSGITARNHLTLAVQVIAAQSHYCLAANIRTRGCRTGRPCRRARLRRRQNAAASGTCCHPHGSASGRTHALRPAACACAAARAAPAASLAAWRPRTPASRPTAGAWQREGRGAQRRHVRAAHRDTLTVCTPSAPQCSRAPA